MPVNPDFRDLFAALNGARAEFLLVGGYALAVHALPRFTKDLDVWVNPTPENAARVLSALKAFGAPLGELTERDLSTPGIVFQMGLPPNRIDILTSIDGVTFGEAWPSRLATEYGGQPLPVIGRAHLVANKRASARPQDLVDADALERPGPSR
ncbi:MAG TPA: nucleotidyl transferase AbiEii/AbiGii toxin family protein [Anaeromyxobacteraceae bacterium]|nr:nucleotidyl transferase AbiEii/AbiGii toxin family protein [Anaeromyxobacteraceae bacterium]